MSSNQQGQLRINIIDVYGKRIGGTTDVRMRHQVLSHFVAFNGRDSSEKILIKELFRQPQGRYKVDLYPSTHLPVSQFVTVKASGITDLKVTVPVNPRKILSVEFPPFASLPAELQTLLERSEKVLTFEGKKGEELYIAIDDLRKACLLNIAAKCGSTRFANGRTVLSYIDRINELRGERFFAAIPKDLREETKNSVSEDLFREVSGALHRPPAGFSDAGSFKTFDKYGNLQLTFFAKENDWVADIDIDDAAGLEHVFQVLDHAITGEHTNPYSIHEILVGHQQIDPGYKFLV